MARRERREEEMGEVECAGNIVRGRPMDWSRRSESRSMHREEMEQPHHPRCSHLGLPSESPCGTRRWIGESLDSWDQRNLGRTLMETKVSDICVVSGWA